ncbi:MAG: hypothetical protein JWP94_2877 [Mucilaginibacter sp.]|nr:hypothetical protein [Mucilaginibacter sp.]
MRRHDISQVKMNFMRERFISGTFGSTHAMAKEINVSTITSWRYKREFEQIKLHYPERLDDMHFFMPQPPKTHQLTPLYQELVPLLPVLLSQASNPLVPKNVWRAYKLIYPQGYSLATFRLVMYGWIIENVVPVKVRLITSITTEDQKTLSMWRRSNDRRRWQIAVVLENALKGYNVMRLMDKAQSARDTVNEWINIYKTEGLKGYDVKYNKAKIVIKRMQLRKENLIKLLHETPKLYGLNRTSWTIKALTDVYSRIYSSPTSWGQIKYTLKESGYNFRKSRDMLTSQDPKFREKIAKIQRILRRLKPNEKFFSIDEYGPVGVKIKGGVTLKHKSELPSIVPHKQKHKGIFICTTALELSTNQVSHFYSLKKNTFEMIKLVDLLLTEYKDNETLYLSWDNVSWHRSNILFGYIKEKNNDEYRAKFHTPAIKVVPLPSGTQYLNIVESVFSGLARTVIHNSNYDSLDECKAAVSLYFDTRNRHFLENPRRAGKKIWGKEIVAVKFSETQNCRNPKAMCARVYQKVVRNEKLID